MSIISGTVSVEDGTKTIEKADQYDVSRKVRVELTFSVEDGQDAAATLDYAAQLASQQVARQLGRAVPDVSSPGPQPAPPAEAGTRARRTKAQIEADNAAKAAGSGATVADPAVVIADASVISDPDVAAHIEENKPAADASAVVSDEIMSDDAGDEEWSTEVVADTAAPITDAELNDAVQKKNGELKDPPKIRGLIGSFNPDPTKVFQLREVPIERRAEFLAKLAELK